MSTTIDIYINAQIEAARRKKKRVPTQYDIGARRRGKGPLSRRTKPGGGLINFWDLGQRKNGSTWEDLDYRVISWDDSTGYPRAIAPTLAQWQGLIDEIFQIPVSDWKTNYRELTYETAERIGIDLVDPGLFEGGINNPPTNLYSAARSGSRYEASIDVLPDLTEGSKWSVDGLTLVEADFSMGPGVFGFQSSGASLGFGAGEAYQKVTSTYDYNDSPVSFTLALGQPVNVYLVPRLMSHSIVSNQGAPFFTPLAEMVGPYRTQKRTRWFDMSIDIKPSSWPNNLPLMTNLNFQIGTFSPTKSALIYNDVASDPLTRTVVNIAGTPTEAPFTGTPFLFVGDVSGSYSMGVAKNSVGTGGLPEGLLVGVIEQGGQFYYFWVAGSPNYGNDPDANASIQKLYGLNG